MIKEWNRSKVYSKWVVARIGCHTRDVEPGICDENGKVIRCATRRWQIYQAEAVLPSMRFAMYGLKLAT
jgi:hypothetical protein